MCLNKAIEWARVHISTYLVKLAIRHKRHPHKTNTNEKVKSTKGSLKLANSGQ